MPGAPLNMPWKIGFEILIFPCGVSTGSFAPPSSPLFHDSPSSSSSCSCSTRRAAPRPPARFFSPDKFRAREEKIRSSPRLNTCVSIVNVAATADLIVLNFYVMCLPLVELSFFSTFRRFSTPPVSSSRLASRFLSRPLSPGFQREPRTEDPLRRSV